MSVAKRNVAIAVMAIADTVLRARSIALSYLMMQQDYHVQWSEHAKADSTIFGSNSLECELFDNRAKYGQNAIPHFIKIPNSEAS
ncbi:hypothetical protein N9X53_07630 [Mariniblastus sp.]|nr:hypothetical protein [Mariniblastus sp.]